MIYLNRSIEDKDEIKELMLLLSLKGMENINNKIDESEVDNLYTIQFHLIIPAVKFR